MNELVVSDAIYRKERAVASLAGVKITGCKHGVLVSYQGIVSKLLKGHWLNGLLIKRN